MCAGSTFNKAAQNNFDTAFGKGFDPIGNMKNTVRAVTPQVPQMPVPQQPQQSLSIQQAPQPKAKTAKKPTEMIYS
jgi:hypothetical protein